MKKHIYSALFIGFVFGIGLAISGMTKPSKVIGFLDVFGNWDPSLMFVMIGAIVVHWISYRIIRHKPSPLFAEKWHIPERKDISPNLVGGGLIFGIGWGLAGYCPGPAIAALATLKLQPMVFVVSMALGMMLFRKVDQKWKLRR